MLRMILALLVIVTVVGRHSYAHACSCALPPPPVEALGQATAVFEGELLDSCVQGSGVMNRTSRFLVLRAWKGVSAETIVSVRTASSSAACGYDTAWATGTLVLVYAGTIDGVLTTTLCTRTRLSSEAQDDIAALGIPSGSGGAGLPQQVDASCSGAIPTGDAGADGANMVPRDGKGCAVSGGSSGSGRSPFLNAAALAALVLLATRTRRRRQPRA